MLRTSPLWKILSLCLVAHAGLAVAQQATPSSAPPKLERVDEGGDAPITVAPPKAGGSKVTEKREGGRVTEVQVKSGPSTYTMKPNTPAGNAQAGDATASGLRAPQWQVMEFDLSKKKKTERDGTDEAAAPANPAPGSGSATASGTASKAPVPPPPPLPPRTTK